MRIKSLDFLPKVPPGLSMAPGILLEFCSRPILLWHFHSLCSLNCNWTLGYSHYCARMCKFTGAHVCACVCIGSSGHCRKNSSKEVRGFPKEESYRCLGGKKNKVCGKEQVYSMMPFRTVPCDCCRQSQTPLSQ